MQTSSHCDQFANGAAATPGRRRWKVVGSAQVYAEIIPIVFKCISGLQANGWWWRLIYPAWRVERLDAIYHVERGKGFVRPDGRHLGQAGQPTMLARLAHPLLDMRPNRLGLVEVDAGRRQRASPVWIGRRSRHRLARSTGRAASVQAAGSCAPRDVDVTRPKPSPCCPPDRAHPRHRRAASGCPAVDRARVAAGIQG
jgi:hypothetical protein